MKMPTTAQSGEGRLSWLLSASYVPELLVEADQIEPGGQKAWKGVLTLLLPPGERGTQSFPIAPEQVNFRVGGWAEGVLSQDTDGQQPQSIRGWHHFLPAHAFVGV